MKRALRTVLIVVLGIIAVITLVSGGFWLAYGGDWSDYLQVGLFPFAILVPSGVWDYSEAAGILVVLGYWLLFLAAVSVAWLRATSSGRRHQNATHWGITLSALVLYVGCYWFTLQALAAAVMFSLSGSS